MITPSLREIGEKFFSSLIALTSVAVGVATLGVLVAPMGNAVAVSSGDASLRPELTVGEGEKEVKFKDAV